MVEIFKTNINDQGIADSILENLMREMPTAEINFDLDDCDRILRIKDGHICVETIIQLLQKLGFACQLLD